MSATALLDVQHVGLLGHSIAPGTTISTDTTTDGTAIDMQLSDGPITGFFHLGAAGDGTSVIQFKLIECDTSGGSYTVIADGTATALTASATANDNTVTALTATKRSMRYVKARVVTTGGGTPSFAVSSFVLGRKKITGSGTGYVS